jgi:hypothetical protein
MKITVKDAKIDNHTYVIAFDASGCFGLHQYGELQGGAYVIVDDIKKALRAHEPRTDADRVAFVSEGRYDIQFSPAMGTCDIYDNMVKDSVGGDFGTWTEAVDYLMDMEEQA